MTFLLSTNSNSLLLRENLDLFIKYTIPALLELAKQQRETSNVQAQYSCTSLSMMVKVF